MKNLYTELGIAENAGTEEIAAALQTRPDLEDRGAILLDDKRRARYDRTHSALKMIGELRHRMALDKDGSWFTEHYPDYAGRRVARPATAGGASGKPEQPAAQASPTRQPEPDSAPEAEPEQGQTVPGRRRRILPIALAVIVAILAVLLMLTR